MKDFETVPIGALKEAFIEGWMARSKDEGGGQWINPTEREQAGIIYKEWILEKSERTTDRMGSE